MTTTVMKFSIIFFLLLGMTLMMCEAQQVEDRLETDLLYTYYKSNLPSYVDGLDVDIGMSLRSLKRLDFENGAVIMNAEIRMVWTDYRLMWYPTEYGNLTGLPIRSSDIWIPDITLYNSILPRTSLPEKLAVVHYTGKICYEPRMRLAVNCTLHQEDDIHNCSLKWGSWAYDSEMLSVSPSSDEIDLSKYRENPDWEIVSTTAEKQTVTYACCPNVYEDIVFSLAIRRREAPGESSGEGSGEEGPGTTSAAASTVSN